MEPIVKYPKTDTGRKAYIQDSLLTSKEIIDDGFQVIQTVQSDRLLTNLNRISEIVISLIILPVIVGSFIYAGVRWLFTFHYPITSEGKRILTTSKYLHECKKYKHEKIKTS